MAIKKDWTSNITMWNKKKTGELLTLTKDRDGRRKFVIGAQTRLFRLDAGVERTWMFEDWDSLNMFLIDRQSENSLLQQVEICMHWQHFTASSCMAGVHSMGVIRTAVVVDH